MGGRMKFEEALEILYKGIAPNPTANNECIELCKKALEKQVPKKVIPYNKFERHCECGAIVKSYCRYCYDCGQALDWSDIK